MTRVSENQLSRSLLLDIQRNRNQVNKYSNEISSGYKAANPGDSKFSGTIEQYRSLLDRIEGHRGRINAVRAMISFQDNAVSEASEIMVRAKELATQTANESLGSEVRAQSANEVWELRDHLISIANSRYQDRYIFGGLDDDDAPFGAAAYAQPATGSASERWVYDNTTTEPGNALEREVDVTDDLTVTVAAPGNRIFSNAIAALERLGRALAGYSTNPATGAPDGTGAAYVFPQDTAAQTAAIQNAMNLLDSARETELLPERVSLGARLKRLDAADSLLDLGKADAIGVLDKLQNADYTESATGLSQAEQALQASFTVTSRVLNLNILDFL